MTIFATDAWVYYNETGFGIFNVTDSKKFYFKINFKTFSLFVEIVVLYHDIKIAVDDITKIVVIKCIY